MAALSQKSSPESKLPGHTDFVIPAKAGIYCLYISLLHFGMLFARQVLAGVHLPVLHGA